MTEGGIALALVEGCAPPTEKHLSISLSCNLSSLIDLQTVLWKAQPDFWQSEL